MTSSERVGCGRLRVRARMAPAVMAEDSREETAIGDEWKGHALGGHEVKIDRQIDGRLQAEQHDKPGRCQPAEGILILARMVETANDNESENRDQQKADKDTELFTNDSEYEVCMTVGQIAFDRPFARTTPRTSRRTETN